uniref:Uncharacterized protein n=1 Tax=Kalanchoe fedtschenkoi TaxID=63787 RepID=A0A7N0TEZ2_KALFE
MDDQGGQTPRKRMKSAMDGNEEGAAEAAALEALETEEADETAESEEMKHAISCIVEKIESFTQLVSELLESGKKLFKDLSDEFEDGMIMLHKEQIDKWQAEMRDLRLLDASNEEINALLQNARYLLKTVHADT